MRIYTIGFTRTTAENFFERLKASGAKRLVDVRLNNVSQLAGFAKRDDLAYFARALCGMDYEHLPELAPTQAIIDGVRKQKGSWADWEAGFLALMAERRVEGIDRAKLDGACLVCSEDRPEHCHRRLIVEYLQRKWGDVEVVHL